MYECIGTPGIEDELEHLVRVCVCVNIQGCVKCTITNTKQELTQVQTITKWLTNFGPIGTKETEGLYFVVFVGSDYSIQTPSIDWDRRKVHSPMPSGETNCVPFQSPYSDSDS